MDTVPPLDILCQPFAIKGVAFTISRSRKKEIRHWRDQFIAKHGNVRPQSIFLRDDSDEDFGVFLLAYPIPARLLWSYVEMCHDIGDAISGGYDPDKRKQDPFQYLARGEVLSSWRNCMQQLVTALGDRDADRLDYVRLRYLDIRRTAGLAADGFNLATLEREFSALACSSVPSLDVYLSENLLR
ncbi:hypothetical protein MMC12_007575, partial [Toensbergia leucococca]|nr:hypothetical protein [Toensbergia leucococca]